MAQEEGKQKGQEVATRQERGGELERIEPRQALSPFEEMDRLFESFFPRSWLRPLRWEFPEMAAERRIPSVDVVDRDDDILVRAELPGVDKQHLDVSVTENTVTIKGSRARDETEEKGNYYRREISRSAFARTVALPSEVDSDKAKATFKEGILEVTMPKVEKAKRRSIQVE